MPNGAKLGLDWTGLDWTGLDWTGLDWTGLDWHNCALFTISYDNKSVLYGVSLSCGVRFCA